MDGVLIGFSIVSSIIVLGFLVGRMGFLGSSGERVLSVAAFNITFPAFMFSTLATSDLATLFHRNLLVVVIAATSAMLVFIVVATLARWGVRKALIGALAGSYVNAANLGLPIAEYVLGTVDIIPPLLLFQLVFVAPIMLTLLDVFGDSGSTDFFHRIIRPFSNPVVLASLAGIAVSATGITLPEPVLQPFELLAQATVPLMLLAFGMSLHRSGRPLRHGDTSAILLATVLKVIGAPLFAITAGYFLFGLSGPELLVPVLCATLPTAQNVYVYSQRYPGSEVLARDTVLLTFFASIPMLIILAAVLGT